MLDCQAVPGSRPLWVAAGPRGRSVRGGRAELASKTFRALWHALLSPVERAYGGPAIRRLAPGVRCSLEAARPSFVQRW